MLTQPDPSTDAIALADRFQRVIDARPGEGGGRWEDPTYDAYCGMCGFDSPEAVEFMLTWYRNMVGSVVNFADSIGCDLGCWLGFSTATIAGLGPKKVYGVDILATAVERAQAWSADEPTEAFEFRPIVDGTIALPGGSMDWVVMNQVLCNQLPESISQSFREAYRILAPGGLLAVADTNNPHCPDTAGRLSNTYFTAEIGDGSLNDPGGSNFVDRLDHIRTCTPDLAEDERALLARETCYLHTGELDRAIAEFVATGVTPGLRFDPTSQRQTFRPTTGWANGAITDPFRIAADLERLGFDTPSITCNALIRDFDLDAQWDQLRLSQGFFVFARKPG